MNMKLNFTLDTEYKPCYRCRTRIVKISEGSNLCMTCKSGETEKLEFPPVATQCLDEHLFPHDLPQSSVLTL